VFSLLKDLKNFELSEEISESLSFEEKMLLIYAEEIDNIDLNARFFISLTMLSAHMPSFKFAVEDEEKKDISIIFRMCLRSVERSLQKQRSTGYFLIRHHNLMVDLLQSCHKLAHVWDIGSAFLTSMNQVCLLYTSGASISMETYNISRMFKSVAIMHQSIVDHLLNIVADQLSSEYVIIQYFSIFKTFLVLGSYS
jgi:hypothetical protein